MQSVIDSADIYIRFVTESHKTFNFRYILLQILHNLRFYSFQYLFL